MGNRPKFHRRRPIRRAALVACAMLAVIAAPAPSPAEMAVPSTGAPTAGIADFNLGAVAGIVDFRFHYPDAVLPFVISGGVLESLSFASGIGQAEGMAGPLPVPAINSGGLLAPTNIPGTDIPVPEEAREGYGSIDFTRFPNACISRYPAIQEGDAEAYCGGSALGGDAAGAEVAAANGHTTSSGDPSDPLQSRSTSVSRAVDAIVPGLQASVHNGWARTTAGLNPQDGVPESIAETHADEITVLGGVVRFTAVHSQAIVRTDGTETGTTAASSFSFHDASIGGIPVVVGADAIVVREEELKPGQSPAEAFAQVSEVLQAHDLEIRYVPASPPVEDRGQISVQSAGIEVVHRGSSVTATDSVYRFGFAAARGNAVPGNEFDGTAGSDVAADSGTGLRGGAQAAAPVPPPVQAPATYTDPPGAAAVHLNPEGTQATTSRTSWRADQDLPSLSEGTSAPPSGAALPAATSPAVSRPGPAVRRPLPAAQPAATVALPALPHNELTKVVGGVLAATLAVAAGLPLRRRLSRL